MRDVPDLAGLQGARSADGPAGWLLFPGAPDGPDGVQQEPERSEVLIDLGHAGLRSMGKGTPPLPHQVPREGVRTHFSEAQRPRNFKACGCLRVASAKMESISPQSSTLRLAVLLKRITPFLKPLKST